MEQVSKRIDSIDVARGIAILLVVIGHAITSTTNPINLFFLSFHMPLFFIISGICLKADNNVGSFWKYVRGKAKHLLIPQLTLGAIDFIYHLVLFLLKEETQFKNPIESFLGWWFLLVMFIISIAIYFLRKYNFFSNKNRLVCLFIFDILLCILVTRFVWPYQNYYILFANVVPFALLFYLIGFVFKKYYLSIQHWNKWLLLVISLACLGLAFYVSQQNSPVTMYNNNYGKFPLFLVTSLFGSVGVLFISILINIKPLRWCGVYSIVIYVTQFHVNVILDYYIKPLFKELPEPVSLLIVVVISLVTVLSLSFVYKKWLWFLFGLKKPSKIN